MLAHCESRRSKTSWRAHRILMRNMNGDGIKLTPRRRARSCVKTTQPTAATSKMTTMAMTMPPAVDTIIAPSVCCSLQRGHKLRVARWKKEASKARRKKKVARSKRGLNCGCLMNRKAWDEKVVWFKLLAVLTCNPMALRTMMTGDVGRFGTGGSEHLSSTVFP